MKRLVDVSYTFTKGGSGVGTVNLSGIAVFDIKKLVAIINLTQGVVIYATGLPSARYTNVSGTAVTLFYDTSSHNNTDTLQIIYDVPETGYAVASGTVSSVTTLTAPTFAKGFILMNLEASTANIRYKIGGTASASNGQQLQPARDTGFIPCSSDVSIIAESGTQNYDIQWFLG